MGYSPWGCKESETPNRPEFCHVATSKSNIYGLGLLRSSLESEVPILWKKAEVISETTSRLPIACFCFVTKLCLTLLQPYGL